MQDFEKVGGAYTPLLKWLFVTYSVAMIFLLIVAGTLYLYIKQQRQTAEHGKPVIRKRIKRVSLAVLTVSGILVIAGAVALIDTVKKHGTYQDYKGRFEIVKTDADIVKNDDEMTDHYIVLKDKAGNKQEIKVNSQNGAFQKGKYADVTVQASADKAKPTLAKPIDSGDVSIKKVEQSNS